MSIAEDLLTGLVASGVALRGEDGKNGLKGDQGEPGPKGDKGDKGDPGQDGKDGTDGNDGKAGKDGKAGVKGDKGSDGVGPDEKVKVDRDDLKAGFLFDKIEAGRGISLRSRTARTGSRLVIDASPTFIGGGGAGPAGPAGPPGADGTGIPDGGTDGQVLTKVSSTDGDADWETPGGGGSDDQTAAEVPFTPAGGIAATDVQAAIQELDTEKAALASAVMDGDAAGGDLSGTYPNPSVVNDSHSHGAGTAPGSGGTQDIAEVLTEGSVAETGQAIFWRNLANNADIQMLRVFGTEFTTDPGNFYDTQQIGRDIIIDDFFTGQINVFDKAIALYGTPASGYPHIFDGGGQDPEAAAQGPYAVAQRTSFVVNGADGVRTSQIDLTGFAATGTGAVVIALRAQSGSVIFDLVGLPTADPATAGRVWNNLGVLMVSAG